MKSKLSILSAAIALAVANTAIAAEIEIPASKVPAFKPGKALKDAVR